MFGVTYHQRCDRVNINGLLNAYDVTDVIAHNCENVNAESTREFYQVALEKQSEARNQYHFG